MLIVLAAGALVALTVALDHRGHRRASLAAKVGASSCFMAVALLSPRPDPAWATWILAGLALGMVGDVCLALPGRRAFLAGLVAFLLGHVGYVGAFSGAAVAWGHPSQLAPVAASAAALAWLWPHAGAMRGAVVAYVVVITAMVVAALAAAPGLPPATARAVVAGSLLFYASDLFVARHRFVAPGLVNRAVGLPLYYAGQLLIAWSVALQ
ncbi:MAG: hypothetical protein AMXMBFR64_62520 [Myxococcales bacterium]